MAFIDIAGYKLYQVYRWERALSLSLLPSWGQDSIPLDLEHTEYEIIVYCLISQGSTAHTLRTHYFIDSIQTPQKTIGRNLQVGRSLTLVAFLVQEPIH